MKTYVYVTMSPLPCFVLLVLLGVSCAFPGEYIPKSFYVIDKDGHQSGVVYIRSRRDLQLPFHRMKRGSAHASSSASASSGSGGGGYYGGNPGYGDFNPGSFIPDFSNFANNFPNNFPSRFGAGSGGNAQSFSSSFSSGGPGQGQGSGSGYGNQPHGGGSQGPVLFSRFGEDQGTGVHVSGSAQGQRGAFSSSSSSIDGDGKIKYSVQSGKY